MEYMHDRAIIMGRVKPTDITGLQHDIHNINVIHNHANQCRSSRTD